MHWCPVPSMNGTGPYCCYCNRGGACLAIDMAYISRPKSYIFVRLSAPHAFLGQLPAEGRLRPAGQPAPPGRVWAASPPYGRLRRPALRAALPSPGLVPLIPPARSSSFCCHCTGAAGDLSREGLVQDQAGAAGRPGFAGASGLRPLKPPSGRFGLRPLPPRQPSLCQQPLPSLPHRATGKGK